MNMESQWGTSDVVFHRERNFGGPVWEQGPVWREQNPIRAPRTSARRCSSRWASATTAYR
jgi:hypothetical protein